MNADEMYVNFRIANSNTPKYGYDILSYWGDYDRLSKDVLDDLKVENECEYNLVDFNNLEFEIEIEDDDADFDHDTLHNFMETSKNIDKSLAKVFIHWCIETDNNVSAWQDFLECYEGVYSSVEEFAENDIEQRIECGILELPDYILDSLDYTKVWEKFENEHITYLENDVHIIRKNP